MEPAQRFDGHEPPAPLKSESACLLVFDQKSLSVTRPSRHSGGDLRRHHKLVSWVPTTSLDGRLDLDVGGSRKLVREVSCQ
jgi:hypothetical protein